MKTVYQVAMFECKESINMNKPATRKTIT